MPTRLDEREITMPTVGTASGVARLPVSIYLIGAVSMLNDIATDLVTPLIPFLLASMGAGGVALGLVEGVANAVSSFLRLWAGRFSDASGGRRKPLAVGGYLVSNFARPLLAIAASAWHVAFIRAFDRVGKGLRSAPRDALIVDLAPPALRARAFGVQVAMDNVGAMLGAVLGIVLVGVFAMELRAIVWISVIPGLMAVLVMAFLVKEPSPRTRPSPPQVVQWRTVPPRVQGFLLVTMLFTLSRVAELFIVLRASELGASISHGLVLWAAFNLMRVVVGYAAGVIADRVGRVRLLAPGWALFAVTLLAFGAVVDLTTLWMAAMCLGAAMAVSEGTERAVIGDIAEPDARGTLFGWYHMVVGLASIPAGLWFGWLWQSQSALVACAYSGVAGLLAAAVLHWRVVPTLRKS
jgi:MFS family permease